MVICVSNSRQQINKKDNNQKMSRGDFLKIVFFVLLGIPLLGSVLTSGCSTGSEKSTATINIDSEQNQIRFVVRDIRGNSTTIISTTVAVNPPISFPKLMEKMYNKGIINSYTAGHRKFSDGQEGWFLSEINGITHQKNDGWTCWYNDQMPDYPLDQLTIKSGDRIRIEIVTKN